MNIIKEWRHKLQHYDCLVKERDALRRELNDVIRMNFDAHKARNVEYEKQKLERTVADKDKEIQALKKKYEKVCQENRHLEKEIERLKNYRI